MSISRRCGCQLTKFAPRAFVYRSTVSDREMGMAGTFSITRLSEGATVVFWAGAKQPMMMTAAITRKICFKTVPLLFGGLYLQAVLELCRLRSLSRAREVRSPVIRLRVQMSKKKPRTARHGVRARRRD